MRKEVPPMGVDLGNPGVYSMVSTLDYSPLGQIIGSRKPDEGKVEFVYDNEGKIRFSRNDVQAATNKFNYTVYDIEGRITETGLYTTDITGGIYFQNYYNTLTSPCSGACFGTDQIINELNGLDVTNSSERSFITPTA